MKLCRTARALRASLESSRKRGQSVGFVPTMGALHEGHLALVRQARRENDRVVCSIFVNPTQFGPHEDLSRYPRPFARDRRLLEADRVDALFSASQKEMYPAGFQTSVTVGAVAQLLCGHSRPTHFGGVATVVLKLLQIVQPNRIYLGQKDYQQVLVVRQMVQDLNIPTQVRMSPTVREKDGLALSSRNLFLSPAERVEAAGLYRALRSVREEARGGVLDTKRLQRSFQQGLQRLKAARVDYAQILDAQTLLPVVKLTPGRVAVAACAVFYSKARLIDNILIRA